MILLTGGDEGFILEYHVFEATSFKEYPLSLLRLVGHEHYSSYVIRKHADLYKDCV